MKAEFVSLLGSHASLLYKIANAYCCDPSEREDLIQEIAAQLWRSFPRYDRGRSFSTWAYRVALNVAISFRRSARRRTGNLAAGSVIFEDIPAQQATNDDLECLHSIIGRFGDFDRALVLLYLDGYDHAASAEMLGITASNVATKLHRIKERLRRDVAAERAKENAS